MTGQNQIQVYLLNHTYLKEIKKKKKPSGIVFEEQIGVEDISKGSVISIDGDSIQIEGFIHNHNYHLNLVVIM